MGAVIPEISTTIHRAIRQAGINYVASLPDSRIHHLINLVDEDPDITHLRLCREEEGVGACAGAYLCGKRPLLLIQNSGLLAAINGLVTLDLLYQIPLVMLISYRGDIGENSFYHMPLGRTTEQVLSALNIQTWVVRRPDELKEMIAASWLTAESARLPVCILLGSAVTEG